MAILVEILSSFNGRIDKFSAGNLLTPFRIIFKLIQYFLRAFLFIDNKIRTLILRKIKRSFVASLRN